MPTGKKQLESVSDLCRRILSTLICFILVPTLLTKLRRTQIGLDSTQPAYDQLTESCIQRKLPVNSWASAECLAMEERGEQLKIFDLDHKNAPTLAEITLKLTDTKDKSDDSANVVHWISDGIKVQNDQWVFLLFSTSSSVEIS
jgi:hypothetical protein